MSVQSKLKIYSLSTHIRPAQFTQTIHIYIASYPQTLGRFAFVKTKLTQHAVFEAQIKFL